MSVRAGFNPGLKAPCLHVEAAPFGDANVVKAVEALVVAG
jgi:hypothetical protein